MAAGRLAMSGVFRLSRRLDPGRIERWGTRLGDLIYRASRRYRWVAMRNLKAAFPEWDESKVREVARATFRNFARSMLEFFYLTRLSPDEVDGWIELEGKEHLDAALSAGHGVVVVTAHLGNWELFARKLVLAGYKVNVIARDTDDPAMGAMVSAVRRNGGYNVLDRDSSVLPGMRCLRRNELLGILPDQNTHVGIFVDFFGRPAATATGPAVFSIRTGAPILYGFARRVEGGRFKAVCYPPLDVRLTGDDEADVHAVTSALTRAIEDEIRKDPAQWLWLHDRWRRTAEAPRPIERLEKRS